MNSATLKKIARNFVSFHKDVFTVFVFLVAVVAPMSCYALVYVAISWLPVSTLLTVFLSTVWFLYGTALFVYFVLKIWEVLEGITSEKQA